MGKWGGANRADRRVATSYKAVVMGVSAGGFKALSTILPRLDSGLPVPVVIVQHMSPAIDSYLVEHLQSCCSLHVKSAEDKEPVRKGVVFVAPPDYHLLLEEDNSLALSHDNRVNYSRPSIDVLFESAAEIYQDRLIGIVLTGANADGTHGLKKIKEFGGLAVVQEPSTAEVDIMPNSAIEAVDVDHIVPLDALGEFVNTLVMGR